MKKAYIFPGQGSQFPGMAKELYDNSQAAKELMESANEILGFRITDIMFGEDAEALKQTKVTQPAVFIHSIAVVNEHIKNTSAAADMMAGHSLGEFSALTASGALSFEDGLKLVSARALAMQRACDMNPGTMAAVLSLDSAKIEEICHKLQEESNAVVVAANYNCDSQVVISGELSAVQQACVLMKEAGARRALVLPVGGAFHSPLMEPARAELASAIENTVFREPSCPVYQNVTACASVDSQLIKSNLLAQLTSPVKWTQTVKQMVSDAGGAEKICFTEFGPGSVLQGLVRKICPEAEIFGKID